MLVNRYTAVEVAAKQELFLSIFSDVIGASVWLLWDLKHNVFCLSSKGKDGETADKKSAKNA